MKLCYYLPQPYLLVTPSDDGKSIKSVETKNLPDYNRGYVIDGWSIMATHDLTVETTNGLLEKMHLTTDSTAVAKTLITNGGSLGTELIKLSADRAAANKKANASAGNIIERNEFRRYRPTLLKVDFTRVYNKEGKTQGAKLKLVDAFVPPHDPDKKLDTIDVLPEAINPEPESTPEEELPELEDS